MWKRKISQGHGDVTHLKDGIRNNPWPRSRRSSIRCRNAAIGGHGMKDYHINIFHSDADGGYIVDIPDLEGCSALGATPGGGASGAWRRQGRVAGGGPCRGQAHPQTAVPAAIYQ